MPQKLLDVLLLGRCSHEFSWPRRAADGQYYQVCLLCAVEFKYDWATMRRTERISQDRPEVSPASKRRPHARKPTWVPRARRIKMEFVELDALIEKSAGISLGEIFALHGEEYYRRLERSTLTRLFTTSHGGVLATGGSLVTDAESWEMVKRRCFTVWLRATPQEHMTRVLRQGNFFRASRVLLSRWLT